MYLQSREEQWEEETVPNALLPHFRISFLRIEILPTEIDRPLPFPRTALRVPTIPRRISREDKASERVSHRCLGISTRRKKLIKNLPTFRSLDNDYGAGQHLSTGDLPNVQHYTSAVLVPSLFVPIMFPRLFDFAQDRQRLYRDRSSSMVKTYSSE